MKEIIRKTVLSLGADVCGFASAEQFDEAPEGFHPANIFPACRSLIVLGVALPKGLMSVPPRLIYGHFNHEVTRRVDDIAFRTAREIENRTNCTALPLPCDSPYEAWDAERKEGRGLISMKHAAVMAGLGSLGKNTMFLSREFGSRLCIGAVLTDLALESDAMTPGLCLGKCSKCIDNCPAGAIEDGHVDQFRCRAHTYGKNARGFDTVDCNACRTVCPLRLGK